MKKKLIAAGAASLAVAAMPVVGVFAAQDDVINITDTLSIEVDATCTFNTENSGNDQNTTYSDTVLNGDVAQFDNNSKHVFNVFCNDNDGWEVSATAPLDLVGTGTHTGTNSHIIDYVATALPSSDQDDGVWNASVSGNGVSADAAHTGIVGITNVNYITTSGGVIARGTAATDGSTFTVTYGAYVGTKTAADTYTATSSTHGGTIEYNLSVL